MVLSAAGSVTTGADDKVKRRRKATTIRRRRIPIAVLIGKIRIAEASQSASASSLEKLGGCPDVHIVPAASWFAVFKLPVIKVRDQPLRLGEGRPPLKRNTFCARSCEP